MSYNWRTVFIIAFSLSIALAIAGTVVLVSLVYSDPPLAYSAPQAVSAPTSTPPPIAIPCGQRTFTLAALGADERDDNYRLFRLDAILLAKVRTDGLRTDVAILGLPRDLITDLPNHHDRINTAFFWAEDDKADGWSYFEQGLGKYGLAADGYMLVNFSAFTTGVDALGGIELDVPTAIDDPDYPGGEFSLATGPQHLDGATALAYARTRKADTDLARVTRQVAVAQAIAAKLLGTAPTPDTLAPWLSTLRTNLSPTEIAWLACAARNYAGTPTTFALTSEHAKVAFLDGVGYVRQPTDRLQPYLDEFIAW